MPDKTKMPKVAKDEKLSRSTRKSFKKKCEAMIPKDETGQPKLKIAGRYKVCLGLGLKMGVLDIGVEARRVSIIRTNQKVRKSVQKQMEPFHNDDFNLDPFLRFVSKFRCIKTYDSIQLRPPLCLLAVMTSFAIGLFALYYFSIFEPGLSEQFHLGLFAHSMSPFR